MSNEIKIPQILLQQKNYCLKINESNTKLFAYVDYLRKLITSTHSIYQKLCKRMIQVTETTQRLLINTRYSTNHGSVLLNFIKNIGFLHLSLNNQLNTNNIALGTKSHKIFKNRLQILGEKLNKCNQLNKHYLEMVELYNKKQKSLKERCQYFNDYEKDVLKYFSLKANIDQYEKITEKQLKIKGRLQELIRFKDEYKINISEIRTSVKEYYQMELNIISQYKKLLLNIRKQKGNNKKIYEPIFQQPSEDASSTIQQIPLSKRSERSKQKSIVLMRKEIIKQYERCSQIQELFEDLMKVYTEQIEFAGKRVDQVRGQDEYLTFISERLIMSEILPPESLKDVDIIINQITLFRSIILKLLNIFGKRTVLGQLKKYRGFNFDKFVEDSNQFAQAQRKNGFSINLNIDYKIVEQKFYSSHNQYNGRYGQRINELLKAIISTVYSEDNGVEQIKNKKNIRSNLFEKKYYQILAHPFFLNRMQNVKYAENVHLKKFNDHISANKIQKVMTLTGFHKKKGINRTRTTCCGLVKVEDKQNEEGEGHKLIDDYHCALKDGLILIQGKLNLYENYLNFTSFFNPKKIFGYSDIRIPKWQINNFSTNHHIFSMVIVVETTHGNLQFTSFMNSPLEKLQSIYNNRKSGVSRVQFRASRQSQLQVLQQRFQRQLRHLLKSKDIITDKLSTYLTQDFQNLSICIEYHINGTGLNHLFEIKINFSEITIDFTFIHDEENDNKEVKNILESISKEIIERQSGSYETEEAENKQNINFSIDCDYSVIQQNEKNKISFFREPSFMNRLSESNKFKQEEMIKSNIQIGPLLTSKQLIYNQQTSRNIELLEQRILQSSANEQKSSTSNNQAIIVSEFSQQETIQKKYTPLPLTLQRPSSKITVKSHSRYKQKTAGSKSVSVSTSTSSNKISPTTILIFLGIVLGVNMMLNFFNH